MLGLLASPGVRWTRSSAAVGLKACALCICDVAGGGSIAATDALVAMRIAVGTPQQPMCPPC